VTDLRTRYLGLELRSPIIASAGPLTAQLDRLGELDAAGVGAIVLPSLFQEQIEHETAEIDRLFSVHHDSSGEASSFFPDLTGYATGADAYLGLVEAARERVDVPVIASLNGTDIGGWLRYARLLEDAGADALELSLYAVAADPSMSGSRLESELLELVAMIVEEVSMPVAVKISPFFTSVAAFAVGVQAAGASGIVMFNRFYLPDLDLETLDVEPRISLSNQAELRLPLRWVGIVHDFLSISIAGSTGVHTGRDVAKLVLAGADVAMTTSALLHHGAGHVAVITDELRTWMQEHHYSNLDEMRGAVSHHSSADPNAYERANYIGNIASYTSRFIGATPRRGTGDFQHLHEARGHEPVEALRVGRDPQVTGRITAHVE
jgi:dihydroorotate dehydrogenase (fumarate)